MTTTNDPQKTVYSIINFIMEQHPDVVPQIVHQHRIKLSNLVWDFHQQTVAYGPFQGMKLAKDTHWGVADKGAMTLGLYEKEVLDQLLSLSNQFKTFIDLGAADGYYGIGVLVGDLFQKSYCFEITEEGQQVIQKNAVLNNVQDRVVIKGVADKNFHLQIDPEDLKSALLFVDIEGAEFDLFDAEIFTTFNKAVIFIELHDWFFPDATQKIEQLKAQSNLTHHWTELCMGARDLSKFKELHSLNDTDRWLLCSEGRGRQMSWVRLDPKFSG
jgi:hypothetical protein